MYWTTEWNNFFYFPVSFFPPTLLNFLLSFFFMTCLIILFFFLSTHSVYHRHLNIMKTVRYYLNEWNILIFFFFRCLKMYNIRLFVYVFYFIIFFFSMFTELSKWKKMVQWNTELALEIRMVVENDLKGLLCWTVSLEADAHLHRIRTSKGQMTLTPLT